MTFRIPITLTVTWLLFSLLACTSGLPGQAGGSQPGSDQWAPDTIRITWMGTAGCYITDGESGFYIDPFVSRYGMLKVAMGFSLEPRRNIAAEWCKKISGGRADAVIVSHSHYDHSMDAPFFAQETGAVLVGSKSTAWVGRGAGLDESQIRIVNGGDTLSVGKFSIRFINSRHSPALFGRIPWQGQMQSPIVPPAAASDYRLGKAFSILIRHPRGTLVHNGSAGYIPGMFEGLTADAVLLSIAGREDTRALFDHIVLPLDAKTVIPIHHDDFFTPLADNPGTLWGVDPKEFIQTAAHYEARCRVQWPTIGQPIHIIP